MRLPDEPGFPALPPDQPIRDLLLAQALDACITAERRLPGSAQEIIARQPAWARGELQRLVGLAGSLDAATSNAVMSSEFRVAARARLMRRIGAVPSLERKAPTPIVRLTPVSAGPGPPSARRRMVHAATRILASLVAAVLAVAATLTASASALPGEPLYGLKEAQEELAVRLAADDQQRAAALLQQANARLDETARLLQQGRTEDATATALRYDQVVQRATMAYVGTIDATPASAPATLNMEASLSQDQDQLRVLLRFAPEPARADLREALVTTERGRALVADPLPVERVLSGRDRTDSAMAAAAPTMAAEVQPSPTIVSTVAAAHLAAVPTRRPLLVLPTPTPTPAPVMADERFDERRSDTAPAVAPSDTAPVVAQVEGPGGADGGDVAPARGPLARAAPRSVATEDQGPGSNPDPQTAVVSPTVTAHDDASDPRDSSSEITARGSGGGGDDHPQATDQAGLGALGVQSQVDRSGRGPDTAPPSVAPQVQELAAGAGPNPSSRAIAGNEGGPPPRSVPALAALEWPTAATTSGDARGTPTPQATPTKPSIPAAATNSLANHHTNSDQRPTSPPVPPPQRNGGGDHTPGNN